MINKIKLIIFAVSAVFLVSCFQVASLNKPKDIKPDLKQLSLEDKIVLEINKSRRKYGLTPVQLNKQASDIAQMHCEDMANKDYFGHWSASGHKPFHRYNLLGAMVGHVAENLYTYYTNFPMNMNESKMYELAVRGHKKFMDEKPPYDGHKKNVLKPEHNYVGIGIAMRSTRFYYCEEFVDQYVQMTPPKGVLTKGVTYKISGQVINPALYGPLIMSITYEKNIENLDNPNKQANVYPDFSPNRQAPVGPWDFDYDIKTGKFTIPFKPKESGIYYMKLYLKRDPSSIPFKGGARVTTQEGFPGGALSLVVR